MQKILSWVALLGGEILLYVAFRIWGSELPVDVRTLDTVVSMVILALFFIDILFPWAGRNGKRLGTLGLRWVATWLYALAAIATMLLCCLVFDASFSTQLLIHCIFLFGLILGSVAVVGSSAKESEHLHQERVLRNGILDMRQRVKQLQRVACGVAGLPEAYRSRIEALAEEIRFVSPCRNPEAAMLEDRFEETLRTIESLLPAYTQNRDKIETALTRAEQLCAERKAIYTN